MPPATTAPQTHQRAQGALTLSFKRRGPQTVLDTLHQQGCLKARFPHTHPPDWPGAVTLNTAGGIAGGDRLDTAITARAGTRATIAAQAAERVYRALPHQTACVATRLTVEDDASLEWLPQETILFDRCALDRHLDIHLAPTATLLAVECLVFGRTAMNEEVHTARLRDRITLRRDSRLVLHDAIRMEGSISARLDRPAIAAGARAIATILMAAPEPLSLDALRAALAPFDAGATLVDGLLIARIVALDGAGLRKAVTAGLDILRPGRPLPRVWQC